MVRVPLDSEQDRARKGVPRVHLVDGLVDTVLVLLSLETVVLDVVNQLKEEHSHAGVVKLIFQG